MVVVFHPRGFDPVYCRIPDRVMNMNLSQAHKEYERCNSWIVCNSSMKGTPDYSTQLHNIHYVKRWLRVLIGEKQSKA
jgi:hypothetical protein